jgi:hypothetical protein
MTLIEFARLGGKARAKALTKARRVEIARNAGLASALKRRHASKSISNANKLETAKINN